METEWRILSAKIAASVFRESEDNERIRELFEEKKQLIAKIPGAVEWPSGKVGVYRETISDEMKQMLIARIPDNKAEICRALTDEEKRILSEVNRLQYEIDYQYSEFATSEQEFQKYCLKIQVGELEQRAEKCVLQLQEDPIRCETVITMTDRFICGYIGALTEKHKPDFFETALEEFERLVCEKARINTKDAPSKWKRDTRSEIPYQLRGELEFFVKALADFIDEGEDVLWLVTYQLVMDSIIRQSAAGWLAKFPQFQNIESKETGVKVYTTTKLEEYSEDSFQFISWLYLINGAFPRFFYFPSNDRGGYTKGTEE